MKKKSLSNVIRQHWDARCLSITWAAYIQAHTLTSLNWAELVCLVDFWAFYRWKLWSFAQNRYISIKNDKCIFLHPNEMWNKMMSNFKRNTMSFQTNCINTYILNNKKPFVTIYHGCSQVSSHDSECCCCFSVVGNACASYVT